MDKKYVTALQPIFHEGKKYYKITSLTSFKTPKRWVKKGETGGYISGKDCLPQDDYSWVDDGCYVSDSCLKNTHVSNKSKITDSTVVECLVYDSCVSKSIINNMSVNRSKILDCFVDHNTMINVVESNIKKIRGKLYGKTRVNIYKSSINDLWLSDSHDGRSSVNGHIDIKNCSIEELFISTLGNINLEYVIGGNILLLTSNCCNFNNIDASGLYVNAVNTSLNGKHRIDNPEHFRIHETVFITKDFECTISKDFGMYIVDGLDSKGNINKITVGYKGRLKEISDHINKIKHEFKVSSGHEDFRDPDSVDYEKVYQEYLTGDYRIADLAKKYNVKYGAFNYRLNNVIHKHEIRQKLKEGATIADIDNLLTNTDMSIEDISKKLSFDKDFVMKRFKLKRKYFPNRNNLGEVYYDDEYDDEEPETTDDTSTEEQPDETGEDNNKQKINLYNVLNLFDKEYGLLIVKNGSTILSTTINTMLGNRDIFKLDDTVISSITIKDENDDICIVINI